MGVRTSIYLSNDLAAKWRASGVPLGELVRRGLAAGGPVDEATLRHVLREELAALPAAAAHSPARRSRGYSAAGDYAYEPYEADP